MEIDVIKETKFSSTLEPFVNKECHNCSNCNLLHKSIVLNNKTELETAFKEYNSGSYKPKNEQMRTSLEIVTHPSTKLGLGCGESSERSWFLLAAEYGDSQARCLD